ncbi:hydroxyacid dehydrogenase [Rariglobus hedericola]|uniref:Hydroxyacid dehydrogenase n=1 Tax=Rariglobus hedericola TaxID=2597822 RepID=A0A556QSP4_9BACT|nr:hydroxyacid dehydrogenase [Rariglobus hedericola]TSJ79665.1 hydroxyacid dehydrogenase [Rariglobus hedericola]
MKSIFLLNDPSYPLIYPNPLPDEIGRRTDLIGPVLSAANWRTASAEARQAEAIFSGWGMAKMDEEFLDFFPNLKIVFYGAGTIRSFATEAMWARGIRVTTSARANAESVSEFSLAQILLSLKRAWSQALAFREKRTDPFTQPAPGNVGSTVGLISLGVIGRLVAERLRSYQHEVIAYDPFIDPELAAELNVKLVSLEEVFERSDVVSCHTPLLDATRGMLQRQHFVAMKRGASFINTARGGVVDEDAMCEVLAHRTDLFALLDVTVLDEPRPDSLLRTLPNVLITPHIAGCLGPECRRMGQLMVDELDLYLAGRPLRYELDQARAAITA